MDIVDELRRSVWHEFVPTEKAADEIERLRRVEEAARAYMKARSTTEQICFYDELKAVLDNW